MATLTGSTIASTYKQLLKVTSEGIGADASAKYIEDGLGTDSALSISTTRVGIGTDAPTSALNVEGTFKNRVPFYSTGTAEQSGTTVTGSGTTWVQSLHVGSEFVWADGVSVGKVATRVSNTEITVATARTVSAGTSYSMNYYGITTKDKFVGINTDNPDHLLTIQSSPHYSVSEHVMFKLSSPTYGDYTFNNSGGYLGWQSSGNYNISFDSNDKFQVRTAANNFRFILDDNSRISLSNNDDGGTTNTIFGKLAGDDLASGAANNLFIGENAGHTNKLSDRNMAIGFGAMDLAYIDDTQDALTIDNIFIGFDAGGGDWATAASKNNVAIGNYTLDAIMNGALYNVAVGFTALSENTTGQSNVGVGGYAGASNTTGDYNVAIGSGSASLLGALQTNAVGDYNIAIGTGALGTANQDDNDGTVAIGHLACKVQAGAGGDQFTNATTAVGYKALTALTTGVKNTAVGYQAGLTYTDASNNTTVGYNAGYRTVNGASGNTILGASAFSGAQTGSDTGDCVAIGYLALSGALSNADGSVAVGKSALAALTSGANNTAVGYKAGISLTAGAGNTVLGHEALDAANAGESSNVAIGYGSMGAVDETINSGVGVHSADHNIAIGENSLTGGALGGGDVSDGTTRRLNYNIAIGSNTLNSTGTNAQIGTIAIGHDALTALTSGSGNTAVGYQSMLTNTSGLKNTCIGYQTMQDTNQSSATLASSDNVFIGYQVGSGTWTTTAVDRNVAIGMTAMSGALEGATGNIAIGFDALKQLTTGSYNIALGYDSGDALSVGIGNVFMGRSTGQLITTGGDHVLIGDLAGDAIAAGQTTTNGTVAIGKSALSALTSGGSNTAVGYQAGDALQGGGSNTLMGYTAGSALTGDGNIMIGSGAGLTMAAAEGNIVIGTNACNAAGDIDAGVYIGREAGQRLGHTDTSQNVAIGKQALRGGNATAGTNAPTNTTCVGYQAGDVIQAGTNNTCIGSGTDPSAHGGTNQTVVGYATTGVADNTVTLGNADVTAVYMAQDSGARVYAAGLSISDDSTLAGASADEGLSIRASVGDAKIHFLDVGSREYEVGIDNQTGQFVLAKDDLSTGTQALNIDIGTGSVNMPNTPAVLAIMGRFQTEGANSNTMSNLSIAGSVPVIFNFEKFDQGSNFNSTTKTGRADATETDKLHDADGGFASTDVGALVYNTTDNTYATITSFQDSGEVTLEALGNDGADIMANNDYYVISHSVFTAPVTGKYMVTANVRLSAIDTASTYTNIYMQASNRSAALTLDFEDTDIGAFTTSQSMLMDMDANDTLKVLVRQGSGTKQLGIIGDSDAGDGHAGVHPYTALSVHLVC